MIVTCPLRIGPPPGLFSARQAPTQAEDNPKGRLEGPGCGALVSQKGGACASIALSFQEMVRNTNLRNIGRPQDELRWTMG